MDVIKPAARMGEAKRKRHRATRALRIKQSIVAGVSIDLQNAVESLEQFSRALALAHKRCWYLLCVLPRQELELE
jgi:hypothetical protein